MKNAIQSKYRQVKIGPDALGWSSWVKALLLLGFFSLVLALLPTTLVLLAGKIYQHADRDEHRGAMAVMNAALDDDHDVPRYLEQGWGRADSLWFYNVTQGSNVIPYDFFLELEQVDSTAKAVSLFRDNQNMDKFRYLLQKPTLFNPNGLPVGFVKDKYQSKDYLGFNCATCHTGQINFEGMSVRIDGGPAMADLDGFLESLYKAMQSTLSDPAKKQRFLNAVLERNGFWRAVSGGRSYTSEEEIEQDLRIWTERTRQYNQINQSTHAYGYARLDAFGRIYNRVLQHVINKRQASELLALAVNKAEQRLLTDEQIEYVLSEHNETIFGRVGFESMVSNLRRADSDYPGLTEAEVESAMRHFFNEANAPVSYPYLWDVAQTDYVQWNGLQSNAGVGALGRNTGQVIGVFASLDWTEEKSWFRGWSLSALISGQKVKRHRIDFQSSVDGVNLSRMEGTLKSLKSPLWREAFPEDVVAINASYAIDEEKVSRGKVHYLKYCVSCHELIDRDAWDRKITSKMLRLDKLGTDQTMAMNATRYLGRSGNIGQTYQGTDVGQVVIGNTAPVRQILTAVTAGVIGTPDRDKGVVRRVADQAYMLGASFFNNDLEASVKTGEYEPDTTADTYASLRAYKARPLNGVWATAPYLHNGSVPSLYDLLLPEHLEGERANGEVCDGKVRPESFLVGSREFDPLKVGFKQDDYQADTGFIFDTGLPGNSNSGHEYAAGFTPGMGTDQPLTMLCENERLELLEFLKTL
ncbi:MAG: di-heme-cytochrome C peroxidase [Pseudomonadales bacterium]